MKNLICLFNLLLMHYIAFSQYSVGGVITYHNSINTPLDNVSVILHGSNGTVTTSTNSSGNYSFSNLSNGDYYLEITTTKPIGGLTAVDMLKFKRHVAGLEIITDQMKLTACDINNSITINSTDLMKLDRILCGIDPITYLNWIFRTVSFSGLSFTINNSNITLNIYGLCRGDINGSYIP